MLHFVVLTCFKNLLVNGFSSYKPNVKKAPVVLFRVERKCEIKGAETALEK